MRENRTYGSEGGAAQSNAPFLPLYVGGIFDSAKCVTGSLIPMSVAGDLDPYECSRGP